MATVNIKRLTMEAIASYIGSNVTGLSGKVSAVQEGPEKVAEFPSVAILPAVFDFTPEDPDPVSGDDETSEPLVLQVGQFEGLATLQLYAKNKPERELYEQRIMDLFLSQQDSPGTIYVDMSALTITGLSTIYAPQIKVRLSNEEWAEEFSFESKRYTFLDLEFAYPALVARASSSAPPLTTLQVALAQMAEDHDLDPDLPPQETRTVNEDGSLS